LFISITHRFLCFQKKGQLIQCVRDNFLNYRKEKKIYVYLYLEGLIYDKL
jgi:hypothetical protein